MKAKKQGLQKLTESEKRIKAVLDLDQIYYESFEGLSTDEKDKICKILNEKLNAAKGIERDKIVKKVMTFIAEDTKNEFWENNHNQITSAISTLMQEYNRMPSKAELAVKTGLSRQTIHKHLKEYASHPLYLQQIEQFRFMTSKVLAKVFRYAVNGDTGAAKLFFNVMGNLNNGQAINNTLIQNQNNYIQINGTVLSQEGLKQLKPEQLIQIEEIIKAAKPPQQKTT